MGSEYQSPIWKLWEGPVNDCCVTKHTFVYFKAISMTKKKHVKCKVVTGEMINMEA